MSHHPLSREEQAKIEIGHTESTPGINRFLAGVWIALILAVPIGESIAAWWIHRRPPPCAGIVRLLPTRAEGRSVLSASGLRGRFDRLRRINNRILGDIQRYEIALKDESLFVKSLVPPMQALITGVLRGGTEDAYCGREGWLFYRRDIDYVMGRGYLDPQVLAHRAAGGNELQAPPQPDPIRGILHFRDQLARRQIALLIVPVPVKPSLHPERFSRRYDGADQPVHNPSHADFLRRLEAAGVQVLDPTIPLMAGRHPSSAPLFLATDTHWTPAAMEAAAAAIAEKVRDIAPLPALRPPAFAVFDDTVTNSGDIAVLLKLPPHHPSCRPESVALRQVRSGSGLWRPDPQADVLLLGDSFANIYSLAAMGWGESAGLAEHLSLALNRPLDAIRRNDAGSWATRDRLARELARGNDRLAGKRIVIWEFAARELAAGDWKLIPLDLGTPAPTVFFAPKPGQKISVTGFIRAIAAAPRPGSVPYKDHIVALHLTDLEGDPAVPAHGQALVYAWSMRDHQWTPAARWLPDQRVALTLQAWSDVELQLGAINRAEIDDESLLLETPCWGEVTP